jgi:hypothetical protein
VVIVTRLGFFGVSIWVNIHPWMAPYLSNWWSLAGIFGEESSYKVLEFRRQRIVFIYLLEVGGDVSWNKFRLVEIILVSSKEGHRSLNQ